ncbi:MAG TPA: class I SAM-dependent methyltransferase [Coriobacteriia bacterium]|nr:class I SAM-dependent methyltransferase [Coriobacteriia bacterium]
MPRSEPRAHRWDAILSRLPADRALVGAEVGVWQGRLSERLLAARPRLRLYMVDRWLAPPPEDSYYASGAQMARHPQRTFDLARMEAERRTAPWVERRCILHMDSVTAAGCVADGSLDFAFLDGDHSYDGVTRDLRAWAPKVRPGGLLCGHDYGRPDQGAVQAAVTAFLGPWAYRVERGEEWTWFYEVKA